MGGSNDAASNGSATPGPGVQADTSAYAIGEAVSDVGQMAGNFATGNGFGVIASAAAAAVAASGDTIAGAVTQAMGVAASAAPPTGAGLEAYIHGGIISKAAPGLIPTIKGAQAFAGRVTPGLGVAAGGFSLAGSLADASFQQRRPDGPDVKALTADRLTAAGAFFAMASSLSFGLRERSIGLPLGAATGVFSAGLYGLAGVVRRS